MIPGEDVKHARRAAGMTQEQLAAAMQIGHRTLQNWEATHVKGGNELKVRTILGSWLPGSDDDVTKLSDAELFMRKNQLDLELARRLDVLRRAAGGGDTHHQEVTTARSLDATAGPSAAEAPPIPPAQSGLRYGVSGRPSLP